MTSEEIIALISVASQLVPGFVALWDKIAANSKGTVRPLEQLLDDAGTNFDAVIAAAQKELSLPDVTRNPVDPTPTDTGASNEPKQ